jgi:PAS domain S-box-containing protein
MNGASNMIVSKTVPDKAEPELSILDLGALSAQAGIGTYIWHFDQNRVEIDTGLADLLGLKGGAQEISATSILDRIPRADRSKIDAEAERGIAQRSGMKWTFQFARDDGETIWVATRAAPVFGDDGQFERIVGINFDVTDEMRSLTHSDDVAREMGHRVSNILTVVTGMTRLVNDSSLTGAEFKVAILERLHALSTAHELLYRDNGSPTVQELAQQIAWSVGASERLNITGPRVVVSDQAAQTLAMALIELATNALKYGALRSDVDGEVLLAFEVDKSENRFEMQWSEKGDQKIEPPVHRGYGTLVLDRVAGASFDGKPTFDWKPTGLTYRCSWPLDRFVT